MIKKYYENCKINSIEAINMEKYQLNLFKVEVEANNIIKRNKVNTNSKFKDYFFINEEIYNLIKENENKFHDCFYLIVEYREFNYDHEGVNKKIYLPFLVKKNNENYFTKTISENEYFNSANINEGIGLQLKDVSIRIKNSPEKFNLEADDFYVLKNEFLKKNEKGEDVYKEKPRFFWITEGTYYGLNNLIIGGTNYKANEDLQNVDKTISLNALFHSKVYFKPIIKKDGTNGFKPIFGWMSNQIFSTKILISQYNNMDINKFE